MEKNAFRSMIYKARKYRIPSAMKKINDLKVKCIKMSKVETPSSDDHIVPFSPSSCVCVLKLYTRNIVQ